MQANIKGLVDRLPLTYAKAMMPLFEAISNAIDAIEEHRDGFLNHRIAIRLLAATDLVYEAGDTSIVVDGFEIFDDGVGFTDVNMAYFKEAHTLSKFKHGGKGIGRFTFLKVFKEVRINSIYEKQGKKFERNFDFTLDDDLEKANYIQETDKPVGTRITLKGLHTNFRAGWSNDPTLIATRIIEHFLIRFAGHSCPPITLESPDARRIDLNAMFRATVLGHIEEKTFRILDHEFTLQAYRNKDGRSRHAMHLCANGREVVPSKLRELLPELPEKLTEGDETYTLIVLVTGDYLDAHANQERTKIAFRSDDSLEIDESLISRSSLNDGVVNALRPLLANDLRSTHVEKRARIEKFVEDAPEYRSLTSPRYKELIENRIQPGLTDEKLDEALLHVKREVEDSVRKEAKHVAALFESATFDEYQDRFQELAEQANELGKAELAKYVTHRRTILDLLAHSLKKLRGDDKYPLEKVLHKIIFPMAVTSKDIFFEQQNLWVIDERLCFHTILTSDKKLKSIAGLENASGKEPDVFSFFYDTPVGVSEPDGGSGAVVIIEFKRPGRNDYTSDPAQQVIQRFVEINKSAATDIESRPINPKNLRYFGYLIADLTPTLRDQMEMNYHPSIDAEGYFRTLPAGNGYVEIISYDKLLNDAKRRNRILFERLGLHKS